MKSKESGIKIGVLGVLVLVMALFFSPLVVQAEVNELPPGIVIGDDKGFQAKLDGTYFIEVKDVMPGKKWRTELSILNVEKDIPYRLSMKVLESTWSGSLDLSTAIQMKLNYENKTVYDGPLSGISEELNLQKDFLDLGTFYSGDSQVLTVELEIDGKYTKADFSENNITENIWEFTAIKTAGVKPPDDGKNKPADSPSNKPKFRLPQTGEEWRNSLIYMIIGMFLILIVALVLKKRFDEEKQKKIELEQTESKETDAVSSTQTDDHHSEK